MNITIIYEDIFKELKEVKKLELTKNERKKEKYEALDRIKRNIKKRWSTAKKLLQVLDHIIYFSLDRGFSFYGKEKIAQACKVGKRTVETALEILRESGEAIIAYRTNPNGNSIKTPVVFLKNHPNFNTYNELLSLECGQECEQENSETPTESRDDEPKKVSTYNLTLNNLINNNITIREAFKGYKAPLVNKEFKQAVQDFLQSTDAEDVAKCFWSKAVMAYKKSMLSEPLKFKVKDVIELFKDVIVLYKQNHIKDSVYGYFYSSIRKTFDVLRREEVLNENPLFNFLEAQ